MSQDADPQSTEAGTLIDELAEWVDCWQCYGNGKIAGCFEDCCSGADCDPEDADFCCAPSRCDICRGKGGWVGRNDA